MTLPRISFTDFSIKRQEKLTKDFFEKRYKLLVNVINAYADEIEKAADAADTVVSLGLTRIDEVLTPALTKVQAAADLGFLVATSSSSLQLTLSSTPTFALDSDDASDLFVPTPLMTVQREGDPTMYATISLGTWNSTTRAFDCTVLSVAGGIENAAYTDWVIAAGSGVLPAVATHATNVAADAAQVAADKAYVAGVALDIESGPVVSVAGKTGAVTLAIADIASLQTSLNAKLNTSSFTGHTHLQTDVDGLVSALAGKQPLDSDLTALAGLSTTGVVKRTGAGTFTAAALAISDTTGLQTALDGKQAAGSYAAAVHTHAISDTTGLQAALDGKASTASVASGTNAYGTRTVSTGDPTGGSDGDIWMKV